MFTELDTVVLKHDMKEYGLKAGDMGTVVYVYDNGKAIEVEFITAKGKTIAVLTLSPLNIRSIASDEILHVRAIAGI